MKRSERYLKYLVKESRIFMRPGSTCNLDKHLGHFVAQKRGMQWVEQENRARRPRCLDEFGHEAHVESKERFCQLLFLLRGHCAPSTNDRALNDWREGLNKTKKIRNQGRVKTEEWKWET